MNLLRTDARRSSRIPVVVIFLSLSFFAQIEAQTSPVIIAPFTSLISFIGTNGQNPYAGLIQGSDGNFYGTTSGGGSSNDGTVFKITSSGSLTTLFSFVGTNGINPYANLIQGSDGNLYGTTSQGGSSNDGTVFKITTSGSLTTLCSFTGSNGALPRAGLVQGSDGNFYGTTYAGGSSNDGTVFKITSSGSLTTLCSFTGTNGSIPEASLIQGSDGNFYGTTFQGGSSNFGTVFKITSAGSLTTLFNFDNGLDGASPEGSLIQVSGGNFYGTTSGGGNGAGGTVYEITSSGSLTTVYAFTSGTGEGPTAGLVLGNDGNFYGTTFQTADFGSNNDGTVFKLTPSGTLTTLCNFTGTNGAYPEAAALILGSDGNLYGPTFQGGSSNDGTVFKLTPPFATLTAGNAFSYQITASGSPTSYGASPLPPGLTVNSSGLISGTPTTAGTYTVTISATNGSGTGTATLNLTVNSSTPLPISWSGAINNVWDSTTANWTYSQNMVTYLNGDTVTFSDSGSGGTITLNGTYSPASLTSSNSAKNYTLSGTGNLTGTMTLTKSGTGTFTLSEANMFTGATTITAGVLQFQGAGAMPAGSAISLGSGTLQVNNDGAGSNGTISLNNPITINTLTTTATIGVANNGSGNTGNMVAFGALNNGLPSQDFNGVTINFTGTNGYLESFSSLALCGGDGHTTTLDPTTASIFIAGNVINQENGNSGVNYDTLDLDGTSTGNLISGVISDASDYAEVNYGDTRITKSNSSTWTLAGASTYHGPTSISGGTLNLTGSWANTQSVTTSGSGILSESSAATLGGTATLTQGSSATTTLAGTNTFTGKTSVTAGSLILSGGSITAGTLADSAAGSISLSGGTLQLQATTGNTTSGGVSNAMTASTTSEVFTLNTGTATIQLLGNANITFNGFSGMGGVNGTTTTFLVNQLPGGNANQVLAIAPNGFNIGTATFNVTGANGYSLSLGPVSNIVSGTTTFTLNPTTANVTLASYTSTQAGNTLALGGSSAGSVITGAITGGADVAVTESGSGIWTLAGANTYTGTTSVNGGTLLVSGSLASGVSVASGGILGGSGTVNGNVTLASGGGLTFNVTTGGVTGLAVQGNLAFNGTIHVTPTVVSGALASGSNTTYTIATYTGTLSGTPAFSWTPPPGGGQTAAFSTSTPGVISMILNPMAPAITSAATVSGTFGTAFSYQITATNNPASYAATNLPTGLSLNATSGLISGTPTVTGTYSVGLSATNVGGTGTGTVVLAFDSPISAPVITSATSASAVVGNGFSYTITANNSPASFSATGLPAGLSLNTGTGVITGVATAAGNTNVTLGATNAAGTGTATLAFTIVNPPVPVITSGTTASGDVNTAFSYTITATNNPTSFTASGLPAGLTLNSASGVISGAPTATGTSTVTLGAANAGGPASTHVSLTLTVNSGAAPVITSGLALSASHAQAVSYAITASNNPTTYSASGLPAGLSVSTGGIISGTPTSSTTATITAIISAANSSGTGSASLVFTMNPPVPVLSNLTATATQGAAFSYSITASGSPTSFTATNLPAGLTLDPNAGVISGTLTGAVSGPTTYTIGLTAFNVSGSGTGALVLTVNPPVPVPVISSSTVARGDVSMSNFSYQITTALATGTAITGYGATNLPPGLMVNATSGLISGAPSTVGTWNVTISASNSAGTGSANLTLTINPAGAPVITSGVTASTDLQTTFTYQIAATNTPTGFTVVGLPSGLTYSGTTGVISGMPTALGTSSITVMATNSIGQGSSVMVLTVNPQAPAITPTNDSANIGVAITPYSIAATNSPTSYGASGTNGVSQLPPGLNLNTYTGMISGTPTVPGTYTVTLSATNAGGTGTATATFTISGTASAPILTASVAGGDFHSLILKSDGTVWGAGDNINGQLGKGADRTTVSYVKVLGFPNSTTLVAVAAEYASSIALDSNGYVWTLGYNGSDDLGNGGTANSPVPGKVMIASGPLSGIIAIAGGTDFGLALRNDGTVWSWGSNIIGQLGNGNGNGASSPLAVQVSNLTGIIAIAAGGQHGMALQSSVSNGQTTTSVWCWGDNHAGELGTGSASPASSDVPLQIPGFSGVTSISGGGGDYLSSDYSLAVKGDGSIWAWGDNTYGELGVGSFTSSNTPVQVPTPSGMIAVVGSRGDQTLALKNDGTLWSWGFNDHGQLGNSTTANSNLPAPVANLTGVITVAAGYSQSLAVKSDGTIWGWGYNEDDSDVGAGMAEFQNSLPTPVANLTGVIAIAAGKSHYLAVESDGSVWSWNDVTPGQVSDGVTVTGSASAVQVQGLTGITHVSCGTYFDMALRNDGTVWTWGQNIDGELGDGTNTDSQSPVQVMTSSGPLTGITAITTSTGHWGMALDGNGHVWTWGDNEEGELGNGDNTDTDTNLAAMISSSTLSGVAAISAGSSHGLVLTTGGHVWTWGGNSFGELGNNSFTIGSNVPVEISGLSGVTALAGGYYHTVALTGTKTVMAWGDNSEGELGTGNNTGSDAPVSVLNLTNVTSIASGEDSYYSVALTGTGGVWAWGSNSNGQLGVNAYGSIDGLSPTGSDTPVQVLGLQGVTVTALACGKANTIALTSAQTVLQWGDSSYEPIGFAAPVRVAEVQASPAPVITPLSGSYSSGSPPTISISTTLTSGTIHYTLDGTEPTASSPVYSTSFPLTEDAQVSAEVFNGITSISSEASTQYYVGDTQELGLPAAVTNLSANVVSGGQINLTWSPASLVDYNLVDVYRSSAGGAYQLLTTLSSSVTSYLDTSVQSGIAYRYYVATSNSLGQSGTSDTTPNTPPAPFALTITLTAPTGAMPITP
jgi:uncharacterized repeat protein (TIGR03803 family)/autotransporter-associated beta strand protein